MRRNSTRQGASLWLIIGLVVVLALFALYAAVALLG